MIEIREVRTDKDLRRFIRYPFQLYRNHPVWVPPLLMDEWETLHWDKNPAIKDCDTLYLLALKDGVICGRVAGIINRRENAFRQSRKARFGWLEMDEDIEVCRALLGRVMEWAKDMGMYEIEGPQGFTNLDKAAMLIDGFEEIPTIATWYNYPYYPRFLEELGFEKSVDYIEHELKVPDEVPEKVIRFASIIQEKYQVKFVEAQTKKELLPYAFAMFDLINHTYNELHGFVPFAQEQTDLYVRKYLDLLNLDYISLITDKEDKLIAFGIALPSFSQAFRKAHGKLFPLGWYHIMKAQRKNDKADLYLIGIAPAWRNKGLNALIFSSIMQKLIDNKVRLAESNPELEENKNVQALWSGYDFRRHKRRRVYRRDLV